jgi:aryl-alcohol dehydrogenase-like predicted oxidoreductase
MLPTSPFGSTGHTSTRVIFGAAALGSMSEERAAETLRLVGDHGVNHIDTAAGYGDTELRLAPWLASNRSNVFLATKTGDRNGSDARASLERSLERMAVDQVDLIQLHNLVEEEEWREALGAGGALAALVEARDEGLCRFIGVTGHGTRIPVMHRRSLEEFPFDSVLFPYNHVLMSDDAYRNDAEELLSLCQQRGVFGLPVKLAADTKACQSGLRAIKKVKSREWWDYPQREPPAPNVL